MALIDAAKDSLGRSFVSTSGVAQVEGKHGLVNQALVDQAVEGWDDLVDRDGIVSETQDTVEPAEGESKTGLLSSLSEELVLDLEITNGYGILGDEPAQAARAVLDRKGGAVLGEGGRRRGLVLGVQETSDGVALGRRNPEVGAAGIEDDLERLRGRSDGDLGEIWGIVRGCNRSRDEDGEN